MGGDSNVDVGGLGGIVTGGGGRAADMVVIQFNSNLLLFERAFL